METNENQNEETNSENFFLPTCIKEDLSFNTNHENRQILDFSYNFGDVWKGDKESYIEKNENSIQRKENLRENYPTFKQNYKIESMKEIHEYDYFNDFATDERRKIEIYTNKNYIHGSNYNDSTKDLFQKYSYEENNEYVSRRIANFSETELLHLKQTQNIFRSQNYFDYGTQNLGCMNTNNFFNSFTPKKYYSQNDILHFNNYLLYYRSKFSYLQQMGNLSTPFNYRYLQDLKINNTMIKNQENINKSKSNVATIENTNNTVKSSAKTKKKNKNKSKVNNQEFNINDNSKSQKNCPNNKIKFKNLEKLILSKQTFLDLNDFIKNYSINLPYYICQRVGSQVMEFYLTMEDYDYLNLIHQNIEGKYSYIMSDVYGNYFFQKFVSVCSSQIRLSILEELLSTIKNVAFSESGTYAIQALVDRIFTEEEMSKFVSAIKKYFVLICNVNVFLI